MSVGNEVRAIAGKELTEMRRQPAVLLLVVLGPFLILAAFGLGYRNEELALRTVFVGPESGPYEEAIDRYAGGVDEYVVPVAFTTNFLASINDLREERVDLVIVLPPEPVAAIEAGRQSEIAVIHNSIDPIEQIGIEFATEVAVRELNATVVTGSVRALIGTATSFDSTVSTSDFYIDQIEASLLRGDVDNARAFGDLLVGNLQQSVDLQGAFTVDTAAPEDDDQPPTESALVGAVDRRLDDAYSSAEPGPEIDAIRAEVDKISEQLELVLNLDPEVVSRPFIGDAESLVRDFVSAEDHIAPGATALLIQHLGVSLAALSMVRDRRRGILQNYQVGPTSVLSVLLGKTVALSGVAVVSAGVLMSAQVLLLGIPLRGSFLAAGLVAALLTVSSVAIGLVVAAVGRTELHASQVAMMLLLVAMFFSGFLLDLDRIREPFRSIGLLIPAQPAVQGLRAVQLRGANPAALVYATLILQIVVGFVAATAFLRREWRSA